MAILKLGGTVTAISGKIGGQVFGTSSNGAYLKNNSWSQQPTTPMQTAQRTKPQQFTQLWRTTTAAQKALWSAAVIDYPYINRVGDTVYYNGYQLFCYLNANLLLTLQSPLLTPPAFVNYPALTYSITLLDTTAFRITYTGNSGVNYFVAQFTKALPAGIQPKEKDYLQALVFRATAASQTIDIINEWNALFGTPLVDNYVYMRFRTIAGSTGYTSKWFNYISSVIS